MNKDRLIIRLILTSTLFVGCNLVSQPTNTETTPESTTEPVNSTNTTPTPDSSSTTEQVEVQDEVKDGVYTNYTYGFRFEFDDQKFRPVSEFSEKNYPSSWVYKNGDNYILLNITRKQKSDSRYDYDFSQIYKDIYNLDSGETSNYRHMLFTNIESKEVKDIKQVVYKGKTETDAQTEHSVSYSIAWITSNDDVVVLDMFTDPDENEEFLYANKSLFDQILESITYLN